MRDRRCFSVAVVLAMFFSALLSAVIVLYDSARPEQYSLLWLLPLSFSVLCSVLFCVKQYLFTKVSVTIIAGVYWIRMVVIPAFMTLGDYLINIQELGRTENTSYYVYMNEAILLQCYECAVVFIALFFMSRSLQWTVPPEKTKFSQKNSQIFWLLFFGMIAFVVLIFLSEPRLIGQILIPIWGTTDPSISFGMAMDGSGEGPLGIFITLVPYFLHLLQIMLPPVMVSIILRKQDTRNGWATTVLLLLVCGATFVVSTTERANSVVCAFTVLLVSLIYTNERIRRRIYVILLISPLAAFYLLTRKASSILMVTPVQEISMTLSAYFAGPYLTAAAIQAGKENPFVISTLPVDIFKTIPFAASFFPGIANTNGSHFYFHRALYGLDGWLDNILPGIGIGYMYFGFLFAPLVPFVSVALAIKLEHNAQYASLPLWRNIWYAGTIYVSIYAVTSNWSSVANRMFFILLAALIAWTATLKHPGFSSANALRDRPTRSA